MVKNHATAGLGKNQAGGQRLCWVDEKEVIPKGWVLQKREKGRKPAWDIVLIECCRWAATAIGREQGRELREPQLLQRSSMASAGEGARAGATQ